MSEIRTSSMYPSLVVEKPGPPSAWEPTDPLTLAPPNITGRAVRGLVPLRRANQDSRFLQQLIQLADESIEVGHGRLYRLGLFHVDARIAQ